ncbi:MAG: acyl-[ACP]--phospholipid O-acyltransferase [Planctomycetaceae bacterium]|nr:MAG: acyl-[ACP]--phospholipid O-acyltransferase [Planctomycetaceae bacterium]
MSLVTRSIGSLIVPSLTKGLPWSMVFEKAHRVDLEHVLPWLALCALLGGGWHSAKYALSTVIRSMFWLLVRVIYRVRIRGLKHLPRSGGVLLTPNHVSWVDGVILLVTVPRRVRFVGYADLAAHPALHWLAVLFDVIPIKADAGPKALWQSLKLAREALQRGECVCVFPEGMLTRTGQIQPFKPGFLKMMEGTNAAIVPVYLHGLWGSIFSYRGGKFFWKWPRRWAYPVTITFGEPMHKVQSAAEVRQRVCELEAEAVESQREQLAIPPRMMLRGCRRGMSRPKVADSLGMSLTGSQLLIGSLALRRILLRHVLDQRDQHVGIWLVPSVGCVLANVALSLCRRVTVNLNYTLSERDLKFIVQDAGVTKVLTSRKMLEKKPVDLPVTWVFLEDLKEQLTWFDKLCSACEAYLEPLWLLERRLGLTQIRPDDPITIIYTSGSTGEPKGVVLSHRNIGATVDAVDQVLNIKASDVVLGVLPIFHSFGYLAALWLPLGLPCSIVMHPNPLDGRVIGELVQQHQATILFGTPTFMRTYLKRCTREQFASLELVVVGAEKLPMDLVEQFREKFGITILEGYGATETSGPAAVNIPDHRSTAVQQTGTKLGSVGRPLPGILVRTVDPETRQPLPRGQEGIVEIKGYNVMLGYLNQPQKSAEVLRDGWYYTGDMGYVDDEGFLFITGRISRFSKIGGEMVPHIRLEELLLKIVEHADSGEQGPLLCVTSVPDTKKGERLVVLHRQLPMKVEQILRELESFDLPNLWLPSADSFYEVPEIPLLGSGKLDLKTIKKMAQELTAGNTPSVMRP